MKLTSLLSVLFTCLGSVHGVPSEADVVVATRQGRVRGARVHRDVNAFLGIPYAQSPVGAFRFLPPQARVSLTPGGNETVFNATSFGPVCYQFHYKTVLGNSLLPTTAESEDCLTLNVFVPRRYSSNNPHHPATKLPVFVWSYGGAYGEGGGSVPIFNPTQFVAAAGDIIVVTWNYRLNLFGFPNSPALQEQNLGLRDQRAALEWLRDHIADFGGDPERIVLGGQSSGADSGSAMVYTHADDPIASGLLLQSGTVQIIGAATQGADAEFVRVATAVGCANSTDRQAELACMRGVDAAVLKHAVSNATFNLFGSPAGGSPMVDNVTLFELDEYVRRGNAGEFAKIPTLIGNMNNEGDSVLNWSPITGVNQTFSDIVTTTMFTCNIALESSFRSLNDVPVWRYRYFGIFPEVTPYPWLRAYHEADVPILMGTYEEMERLDGGNMTDRRSAETKKASTILQHIYASFIRNPVSGLHDDFGWPAFKPNSTTLVELFNNNTAQAHLVNASVYDAICSNPPPIPWDQLLPPSMQN